MYALCRVGLRRAASAATGPSARVLSLAVTRPFATSVRSSALVARASQLRSFSQEASGAQLDGSETSDAVVSPASEAEHNDAEVYTSEQEHIDTEVYTSEAENSDAEAVNSEASDVYSSEGQGDSRMSEGTGVKSLHEGDTPYGIFVRNMVFDATEEHLMEIFGRYGTVVKSNIVRDARGLSRGYGFVYYDNPESMNRAASNVNGSFWHGRRIMCNPRVKLAPNNKSSRRPLVPTTCLYIGNIPYETTDAELNRLFRDLDNVADVRVAVDRVTGWPRGFAHADFHDVSSAEKALKKLQGTMLGSRELRIDFAEPPVSSSGRTE